MDTNQSVAAHQVGWMHLLFSGQERCLKGVLATARLGGSCVNQVAHARMKQLISRFWKGEAGAKTHDFFLAASDSVVVLGNMESVVQCSRESR